MLYLHKLNIYGQYMRINPFAESGYENVYIPMVTLTFLTCSVLFLFVDFLSALRLVVLV